MDETLERRKGAKIKTRGVYRDAVRSSRQHVVHAYGLRWVAMLLLVPLPWSRRPWALSFFTVHAPSEKACNREDMRNRTGETGLGKARVPWIIRAKTSSRPRSGNREE